MGFQGGYNYMLANRMVLGWEADASFGAFQDLNGLSIGGLTNFNSPVLGAGELWRERAVVRHACAAVSAMHPETGCSM